MQVYQAETLIKQQHLLAEGPFWQADRGILSWVDIFAGPLIESQDGKIINTWQLGQYAGAAIPTEDGRYIAALTTGIYVFSPQSGLRKISQPPLMSENHRFNDAACDPAGRFWAGTMRLFSTGQTAADSRLYRLNADGQCTIMREGIGVSNGLAWSPDGSHLYYADTPTRNIAVYSYDNENGSLKEQTDSIAIDGMPDGMTVDEHGRLWIALWGSGAVICCDPDTHDIVARIEVPTALSSSCTFGGPDLKTLYITTGKTVNDAKSGWIYQAKLPVAGLPDRRCRLDL